MPAGAANPVTDNGIALGGFVMEQAMLQGIQARAEGNVPPAYSEALEVAVWLIALAADTVAAVFFVAFKEWLVPFSLGILAVLSLLCFTFWQPPLWSRVAVDMVLCSALAWFAANKYVERAARPISPTLAAR